ncbi:MAG: hypothetical protein LBF61_02695 [Azoarcus sp.]|jgi:fatty acid desaturase|nr:hypothetical protein [Azoarcus sp.]
MTNNEITEYLTRLLSLCFGDKSGRIVLIFIALGAYAFAPAVLIWAINTLFATAIPFNFWTWLAAFLLPQFFRRPCNG